MDLGPTKSKLGQTQPGSHSAELNLTDKESLYRRLVEDSIDVIWTTDTDGRFTYLSPQFKTLFGFDPATIIGKTHFEFIHPHDYDHIVKEAENLRKGHAPANVEFRHLCSDDTYKWVAVKAKLTYDYQGVPVGSQGIIRDIRDLKITQLALQVEQNRSRLISENVPGMIYRYVLRANGSDAILYAGPQCRELFEIEPEEAMEDINKMFEHLDPQDSMLMKARTEKSAENLSLLRMEYRVRLPKKGLCWRLSISQPAKTINGDIVWDGIISDITDSKNAEIQLQNANEQLEKTTKIKDEFLATMSHELRTPLTAILSINEGLQQEMYGPITSDQASSYKVIQESGQHLLDLINEVLDLAKIESGSVELIKTEFDIRRLCEACLELISPQAKEKNIELCFESTDDLTTLESDEKRLRQILVNLLNNAVKFTNSGGKISLKVQKTKPSDSNTAEYLRFSVTDNGIGMDESAMDTLFEPFSQAQTSLNREYNGIGLGLALVKKFTELLSGKVCVKSTVGSGTCFCIDLPLTHSKPSRSYSARDQTPAEQEQEDYTKTLYANNKKDSVVEVLLAEDNDAVAVSTTRYLELTNCRVRRVCNGKDAVIAANEKIPDIILMDIQMPGVDGLECIKRLRQYPALEKTPVIAVTGLAMQDDSARCLNAGANRYLSKPYRMQTLLKVMQQLLQPSNTSETESQSTTSSKRTSRELSA